MNSDLPSPPFMEIDGLCNFRDCGGYPIAGQPSKIVRLGVIYRSADPSTLTSKGVSQLRELNITRTFDLRSDREIQESSAHGWGQIMIWDPAVRISATIFADNDYEDAHRTQRDHNLKNEGDQVVQRSDYCKTPLTSSAPLRTLGLYRLLPGYSRSRYRTLQHLPAVQNHP